MYKYACMCTHTHTHTTLTTLSQPHFRPTGLDPRTFEEEYRENSGYIPIADFEGHADINATTRPTHPSSTSHLPEGSVYMFTDPNGVGIEACE